MNQKNLLQAVIKTPAWILLLLGIAAVLTLTSAVAEERFLMPTGPGGGKPDDGQQPFDPNPAAANSPTRQILTYGTDADGNTVPRKTVRITNNADQTIYPVMRDPNSNVLASDPTVGLYNPYDPVNKEYRGYIGYEENGQYYFGLRPGESILVQIPLVFWNGARIGLGTDGKYLAIKEGEVTNPLRYDPNAMRAIAPAEKAADSISNGVVMWYRAETAMAPNDDTEDQLAEWTIRDHEYLSKPKITARTNSEIPDTQLLDLINYDVSNVDNLYLPVAMAALDVWVVPQGTGTGDHANRDGWKPGSHPEPYGWTGSTQTIEFLQGHIRDFTVDNNQLLGQYFGGKGWPFYNIPNPANHPDQPIKIPSGANIFAQSPLKAVPSSYGTGSWENDKYMLSSGGTEPIKVDIAGSGTPSGKGDTTVQLSENEPAAKISFVAEGQNVGANTPPDKSNPVQQGTTVVSVDKGTRTVTLSKPLVASTEGSSFSFTRPAHDYASEAMMKLWFSWADYYWQNWKRDTPQAPTAPKQIKGSMDLRSATLTFTDGAQELVEGMTVTGPGLDNAQTERGPHKGKAVILEIADDKKSVVVSQVAASAHTDANYTFGPPVKPSEWSWTSETGRPNQMLRFSFTGKEPAWHDPYEFSQTVYLIMASIYQIGEPNNDSISKFMQNIIGANMGFIYDQPAKDSDDGRMLQAVIRDRIKSALRGVSDFTRYPDKIEGGKHVSWYPNPAEKTGGQDFNVYNLDPFVWFVHVILGFSGYGFSVDDDTADVGAGGATQLQISVAGPSGLKNPAQWSIQAPFGPVRNISAKYSGPDQGDSLYNAIGGASNATPIVITSQGAHHLESGQIVNIDQVHGNTAANGTFKVGHASKMTFELLDPQTDAPVAGNGEYVSTPSPGRWSLPPRPYIDTGSDLTKAYYRVTGDDVMGTFEGSFVSVNGHPAMTRDGHRIRVEQLGQLDVGRLILSDKLRNPDGSEMPAGTYTFDFFGDVDLGAGN